MENDTTAIILIVALFVWGIIAVFIANGFFDNYLNNEPWEDDEIGED